VLDGEQVGTGGKRRKAVSHEGIGSKRGPKASTDGGLRIKRSLKKEGQGGLPFDCGKGTVLSCR